MIINKKNVMIICGSFFLLYLLMGLCLFAFSLSSYVLTGQKALNKTLGIHYSNTSWMFAPWDYPIKVIFSPFRALEKLSEGQQTADLEISMSMKNLTRLQSLRVKDRKQHLQDKSRRKSLNATLSLGNDMFAVKIKGHGTVNPTPNEIGALKLKLYQHRDAQQRFAKPAKAFGPGSTRFELLPFDLHNLAAAAFNNYAVDMGLIAGKTRLKQLLINDVDIGTYFFAQSISRELLEHDFQITEYSIFRPSHNLENSRRFVYPTGGEKSLHSQNWSVEGNSKNKEEAKKKFQELIECISGEQSDCLFQLVNTKHFSAWLALNQIYKCKHELIGYNYSILYNHHEGLFYPIFRAECSETELAKNKISLDKQKFFFDTFDNTTPFVEKLSQSLLGNDSIYQATLRGLRALSQDWRIDARLIDEYTNLLTRSKILGASGSLLTRWNKKMFIQQMERNIRHIEEFLAYGELIPNSFTAEKGNLALTLSHSFFDNFSIDTIRYHILGSDINKSNIVKIRPQKLQRLKLRGSKFLYAPSDLDRGTVRINLNKNACQESEECFAKQCFEKKQKCIITHASGIFETNQDRKEIALTKPINLEILELLDSAKGRLLSCSDPIDLGNVEIMPLPVSFDKLSNKYTVKSGTYILDNFITFPPFSQVIFEPGTTILVTSECGMLIHGSVDFEGTPEKPVRLIFFNNGFSGGLFANGFSDKNSVFNANNLEVYGGQDRIVNGVTVTSGLGIYGYSSVTLQDSVVAFSTGDDGLNVKKTENLSILRGFFCW